MELKQPRAIGNNHVYISAVLDTPVGNAIEYSLFLSYQDNYSLANSLLNCYSISLSPRPDIRPSCLKARQLLPNR